MDCASRGSVPKKVNYLQNAADAVLAGKNVQETETYSVGCTIKWK